MKISYNVSGEKRKELVMAIGSILQVKPIYKRMPTCAYEIGTVTVDKEGALICEDDAQAERIAHNLTAAGFTAASETAEPEAHAEEIEETAGADADAPESLTISMPKDGFTDESIENLKRLVESKAALIRKALGAEDLTVTIEEDKVSFPWFAGCPAPDEISAYAKFIGKLCGIAKIRKRVSAKEKPVENEKFAFRMFLIRLGLVGDDYKQARKILLKNLPGNSAFKNGAPPKAEGAQRTDGEVRDE